MAVSTDTLWGTLQPASIRVLNTSSVTSCLSPSSVPRVHLTLANQWPCSFSPWSKLHSGTKTGSLAPSSNKVCNCSGGGESFLQSLSLINTWARLWKSSIARRTVWRMREYRGQANITHTFKQRLITRFFSLDLSHTATKTSLWAPEKAQITRKKCVFPTRLASCWIKLVTKRVLPKRRYC